MAIFGSGLSRACLFGSLLSSSLLLVACTDGATANCAGDAGCGYPLVEASVADGSADATLSDAADAGNTDADDADDASDDASDDAESDAASDTGSSDTGSSDTGSSDATSVDAPVDSPTQG